MQNIVSEPCTGSHVSILLSVLGSNVVIMNNVCDCEYFDGCLNNLALNCRLQMYSERNASRKHLRTNVTPDFHLTYSKNGGNLGSESK